MRHRTFRDRQGKIWDVWQVHPSAAERRFSQRRVNADEGSDTTERRGGVDRREPEGPQTAQNLPLVAAEFALGWLCFESAGAKRRLAPIPEGWDRADDKTIEQWCRAAKPVARRPSGSIPGTGGAPKVED